MVSSLKAGNASVAGAAMGAEEVVGAGEGAEEMLSSTADGGAATGREDMVARDSRDRKKENPRRERPIFKGRRPASTQTVFTIRMTHAAH